MLTPEIFLTRVFELEEMPSPRLGVYGEKLTKYLQVGSDALQSPDTGEILPYPPMLALDEEACDILGYDIPTTAGYRTPGHQRNLIVRGYKAATFISPHFFGALDKDARPREGKTEKQVCQEIADAYKKAAIKLRMPAPRLGMRAYNYRFVHVDLLPMLFSPFTGLEHPSKWPEVGWTDLFGKPYMPQGMTPQQFFAATITPGFTW